MYFEKFGRKFALEDDSAEVDKAAWMASNVEI